MTDLAEKIKAIRLSKGMNQSEFGDAIGVGQSTVARWERGAQPAPEFLYQIASIAKVTVDQLLGIMETMDHVGRVPVIGFVGAGAMVLPLDVTVAAFDYIDRPAFVTGSAVAVEVQGDSLFPVAENGWKLVYAGTRAMDESEVLNRLCVVQLTDGRAMVKRVMRGSEPQRFHLGSTNAPLIENAELVWAAPVKAIIPT
jgi:transcriptional regulator with XRE-family HTH domain